MIARLRQLFLADRNMYLNILGTAVVKALSLLLNIYSITAYLHYFNNDKLVYGVWLTVISILNWVVTFDLGIGNGLRNRLVPAISEGDILLQKTYISSSYILLSAVSILVFVVSAMIISVLNWNSILNIDQSVIPNNILKLSIIISLFGLIIHFVLKLVISILYALKMTTLGSIVTLMINSLIILYSSLFQNANPSQAIVNIAIAYALTLVIPLVVVTALVFTKKLPETRPSFKNYNHTCAVSILKLGGQFFMVQLLLLIINSTNEFIITQLENPESVVEYNIYFKLFSAVIALFSVIINPVWSSISESYAKKDYAGVLQRKNTVRRLGWLFCMGNLGLAFLLPFLVKILYPDSGISINYIYSFLFALFSSIMIMINAISCVENGINYLKPQIIGNTLAALIKLPIVWFCFGLTHHWIAVLYANIIIMTVSLIIQSIGLRKKVKTFCIGV